MYERLKSNIAILKQHNLTHEPVYHITDGKKHEVDLINEIVEDCEEIFNDESKVSKNDSDDLMYYLCYRLLHR